MPIVVPAGSWSSKGDPRFLGPAQHAQWLRQDGGDLGNYAVKCKTQGLGVRHVSVHLSALPLEIRKTWAKVLGPFGVLSLSVRSER